MNRVLVAILFLFLPLYCVADDLFDIKPVADGVYAAIAKPAFKINCNAAMWLEGESCVTGAKYAVFQHRCKMRSVERKLLKNADREER